MFRRWKENGRKALLTMQAAVLSGMMTICSYAETVQDANWMKEDATSGGLFTEAITKVQMCPKRLLFCDCWWLWDFCTALYLCRRKTVIW